TTPPTPCTRHSIPTSAAPRSTWRRPTPTHSWRRRRRNADGGAPHTKLRSFPRKRETRAQIWVPAFAGTSGRRAPRLILPSKFNGLQNIKIYLALHRSLLYLTIYRT